MRNLWIAASALAFGLGIHAPAGAADDEGCCFHITPYLWASGVDGDIQARGTDTNVSADFSDVIDNLDIGGSVLLEAKKDRWVSYAMVDYLGMSTGDIDTPFAGVDAEMDFDTTLATVGTGYRFQTGERSTIDVYLGLRYAQFDAEIAIQTVGQRDADNSLYDGIVALRPRLALSRNWYFSPTMSVGAGDSDLTWELSPQFVYQCCDFDIRFGYRSLNYDFEKGQDSADISIHGPIIGFGFAF
jgi:hypothetical protein